jgi:hypothetical protein
MLELHATGCQWLWRCVASINAPPGSGQKEASKIHNYQGSIAGRCTSLWAKRYYKPTNKACSLDWDNDADKLLTGSIIPLSPGRMRNDFFPNKTAEYMTTAQLREIGMLEAVVERQSTFGIAKRKLELPVEEPDLPATQKNRQITVKIDLLEARGNLTLLRLR